MAQATTRGPDLESVSTGSTPRRVIPLRPLPNRVVPSSDPYGTAANDAPMMMQPLSLGNAGLTVRMVRGPAMRAAFLRFRPLRPQALAGAPTP